MDDVPVTIIVKAPNQQFEDQTIQCELSWTIKRLKGYLSEVYPNKPSSDEQKLIYSGQLLNDAVILKDVLRQYEGQNTHTVHLVFTPKNLDIEENKAKRNIEQLHTHQTGNVSIGNIDGIRQRNVTNTNSNEMTNSYAQFTNNPHTPYSQFQPQFAGGPTAYPQQQPPSYEYMMAQQLAMQQMYIQYVNQYMTAMQQGGGNQQQQRSQNQPTSVIPMPFFTQPMAGAGVNNPAAAAVGAAQQAQQQPQPQPQQAPVVQPAVDNNPPEEGERLDWLDIFYVFSRLMVLVTLVYFYSSPIRLMIVIFFTVLYYLYRIGFFRQANQEPNNNNNNNVNNNQQINRQNAAIDQNNQQQNGAVDGNFGQAVAAAAVNNHPPNAGENGIDANNGGGTIDGDAMPSNVDPVEQNNRIPAIALLRTFVLSFFASLIPETPAL